ncbi:MAG: ABC transporter substrate-binding protein, partial [Nitrospinota bacterium]
MKKLRNVLGLATALAYLAVIPWGASLTEEASAAEKVVFQFDWVPYGKYAGYYAAKEKGLYKAAGLDVTFERGYGGASPSVAAGKHDYGIDGMGSVVIARSKNIPVKMVSVWHERGMYTLFMLKSSGIRTPKDLEGKNIGMAIGDVVHRNFPVFAQAVGLKKWTFVPLRPAAKNPSLLAKKVDAIGTFTTVGIPLRLQAKKMGDGIVEFLWSDFGIRLPTDGIVTRDKTIAEKPGQIKRFLSATLKGNA